MVEEVLKQAISEDKKVFIHYRKGNGDLSERVIGGILPSEEYGEGYIEAFCYTSIQERIYSSVSCAQWVLTRITCFAGSVLLVNFA